MGGAVRKISINLLFCLALLSGCVHPSAGKMNNLAVGMTKQEVVQVMGLPVSTSAQAGAAYLTYQLDEENFVRSQGHLVRYYVRLIDGKVESFGRVGDFDSTKDQKHIYDIKIQQEK